MKNQAQIERKNSSRVSTAQQRKKAGTDETITIVATRRTGLPGAIYERAKGSEQIVETSRFNWKIPEFNDALRQGRFLITALNQFHRLAMDLEDRRCDYDCFLEIISDGHIQALRGSVPLYWIEECRDQRKLILISLRGQAPGIYPADPRSVKDARTLENEIRRRTLADDPKLSRSRKIANLSNKYIRAPRGGTAARQLRLLQLAYITAHSTQEELSGFCNAMEVMALPTKRGKLMSTLRRNAPVAVQ
jgi:hypothetical protein